MLSNRRLLLIAVLSVALTGCPDFEKEHGIYTGERADCDFGLEGHGYPFSCRELTIDQGCYSMNFDVDLTDGEQCTGVDCPMTLCNAWRTGLGQAEEFLPPPPFSPVAAWPEAAVSVPQRTALLAFYGAMGGANWYDHSGWGGPAGTECSWFGVRCDAAKTTVIGLEFHDNNLEGTIPGQLASLTGLQSLVLSQEHLRSQPFPAVVTSLVNLKGLVLTNNNFTGPLPATISKLTKLETLVIEDQLLSAPLPASLWSLTGLKVMSFVRLAGSYQNFGGAHPADLSKLKNLRTLRLSGNAMTGAIPASWASLTQLKTLVLTGNGTSGPIPPWINKLSLLQNLSLDSNQLQGAIPPAMGSLTKLDILDLSFNQLSGPIPPIGNLTSLRFLSLQGNRLTGPLPGLAGFDDLVSLSIGPAGHNGPFPASWMSLRQLQVLALPKAGLTGTFPDLSLFSDLAEVNLENNAFTPGPVPSWALGALPGLRKIFIAGTNRQGAFPDFGFYKGQLTHLGLGRNPFTAGEIPSSLQVMKKLTFLDLEKTNRTGPIPTFLTNFTLQGIDFLDLSDNALTPGPVPDFSYRLTSLDMARTGRTGALPAYLSKQFFMQRLSLADNQLSGGLSPGALPPILVELDLSRNRLSGPLPLELGNEGQLRALQLSGNQLSGEVPATILSLTSLYPGALDTPLYGKHVGLDLRFNMLTSSNANVVAFAKTRHENAIDFRASQTVPPVNVKAVAASATSAKISWTPIPFQGPGAYTIQRSAAPTGPFSNVGQAAPKTAASFVVTGLKSKTRYYFRVSTTSAAAPRNPNVLTSAPSAVVSVTTP